MRRRSEVEGYRQILSIADGAVGEMEGGRFSWFRQRLEISLLVDGEVTIIPVSRA